MVEPNTEEDKFLIQHTDFSLREQVDYPNGGTSRFYENGVDMVIIDEGICHCEEKEPVFSYMLITDKQNHYMHEFKRVFRFLGYAQAEVDQYLLKDEITLPVDYKVSVADRGEQADVSPLELHFERDFSNVYGMNALKYLSREYGICDEEGNNFFLDYLVRTNDGKCAVEENGVTYHHPQVIGEAKYRNQLRKQNTCALWGIKLFRFSTEDCSFDSRIEDDIKQYFGSDTSGFVDDGYKIDRKFELYEHQTVSLQEIQNRRDAGIKAFLLVLPTAAGKSKIVEEDMKAFAKGKDKFRGLILVPGVNLVNDWEERVRTSLPEFADCIEVRTYTTSLSLKEAMEKGIVAKANVYRIETNIDLSQIRFNGKDYVNADLEKRIRVTSRNELIVDVLKEYFTEGDAGKRQGLIFSVNVPHANEMAKLLNAANISAASYTGKTKNPAQVMKDFKEKKIRFLCACNMISEGWDYPELGILVMARPTLSKVLYLQQIGRGLRKTDVKKNVIVIDVVDEYGAMVKACNMHTIFANPYYVPFGDITKTDYMPGDMIVIDGMTERIERIQEVDINSFEEKYGNYLSQE